MGNVPAIISNRNELDALCRAWLGFDSGTVEHLRAENERLRAVVEAARETADMTIKVLRDVLATYEQAGEE